MLTVLIPAAGFGKRNSSPPVKELLLNQGRPLIAHSFDHLLQAPPRSGRREQDSNTPPILRVVIITRPEKKPFFEKWLSSLKLPFDLDFHLIDLNENSTEWPFTLLSSQKYWSEKNLVLLPDTKLSSPHGLIGLADDLLDRHASAWGVVEKPLSEISSYGNVVLSPGLHDALRIIEKPLKPLSPWVWGCFGFQKSCGVELLENLEKSTKLREPINLPESSVAFQLEKFEDLSRSDAN